MASARSANLNKAIVLVILMITMTQVGYLDSMNSLTNGEERLEQTNDVLETGGSGSSNFSASAEGAELTVGLAMANITFGTNSASSASLAMGYNHACGILDNGSIKCWGEYANGRLGNGATQDIGDDSGEMGDALPVSKLGPGRTATSISSGLAQLSPHTCAVLDDGMVKCWGYNSHGQLGIGSTTTVGNAAGDMGDNLSYTSLGTGLTPVHIDAGNGHTCALFDMVQ